MEIPTNWLLIRNGGIGDTILLSPVIQTIRAHVPETYIELMGIEERVSLLVGDGLADRAVSSETIGLHHIYHEGELPESLRVYLSRFDIIVFYGGLTNDAAFRFKARDDQTVIVHPALPSDVANEHITVHYGNALQDIFPYFQNFTSKIALTDLVRANARQWLTSLVGDALDDRFRLSLHVGAGGKMKQAPLDWYFDAVNYLAERFPLLVLLPQGPADEEAVSRFVSMLPPKVFHVVLEDEPLRHVAACLSMCDLHIGNDSGITHLAAAAGISTLALFVQSDPSVWSPIGEHVLSLDCRERE